MGTVYEGRLVGDDRTMDMSRDATPLFGFVSFNQGDESRPLPPGANLVKALAVAGAALLLILLCAVGGFLFSLAFCPCTLGGEPGPVVPPQQVSVSTSGPYDVMSCAGADSEGTP